jgi:hypothetical protein
MVEVLLHYLSTAATVIVGFCRGTDKSIAYWPLGIGDITFISL